MVKCPHCNQSFLYKELIIGLETRMVEGDEDRSVHYIYSCPKCEKLLNCASGGFE